MNAKLPPIPPENRSDKGAGDQAHLSSTKAEQAAAAPNPDKQGQQANTRINTTHQGHQQDR